MIKDKEKQISVLQFSLARVRNRNIARVDVILYQVSDCTNFKYSEVQERFCGADKGKTETSIPVLVRLYKKIENVVWVDIVSYGSLLLHELKIC